MRKIPLKITNSSGWVRQEEPVTVGIPIPQGEIFKNGDLVLKDDNGAIGAQFTSMCRWPDGSLKWVLLDFQPVVDANSIYECFLEESTRVKKDSIKGVSVEEQGAVYKINTGSSEFFLDKKKFLPFTGVKENHVDLLKKNASRVVLADENNTIFFPEVTDSSIELRGALRTTIKMEGVFSSGRKELLNFISRIHFFHNKSFVKIDFTIWNKGAAKHVGGLWDLGDPGSILFKELAFKFVLSDEVEHNKSLRCEPGKTFEKISGQKITIYQDSSGGENWNSTNHINRNEQVPVVFRGYKVYCDDAIFAEGLRATPVLHVGGHTQGVSTTIKHFWQNFPKAISVQKDELVLELYPGRFNDLHELQGGERKTHSFFIDFGGSPQALSFVDQPLRCIVPRWWYAESATVPYLSKTGVKDDQPYNDLVVSAVVGEKSFFAKREIIDEYGWRNFGEVYADHEAVGHEGNSPLISHYNNQYDQVYGFFREYIAGENSAWFELMDELARHVADIDIYHTRKDREEYNHGLHWHTNHYLDAATCTHRSLSKAHLAKYDARFYGGGPGLEHCYTTGFLYHYFLTGAEISRESLLELVDWVIGCINVPDTFLGQVNMINSLRSQWKQALTGHKIRADRFPLTRGSGNAISALLDAWQLTSEKFYLRKAEEIIRGCIHPSDTIETRDLLNAELAWSYTVCLQAIGKYLKVKNNLHEHDYMYAYAQSSLIHYAKWMLEHEYPYLDKPEVLEFPNETWAAQDLRKSCVFYFAAEHSQGTLQRDFLKKAVFFHKYAISKLNEFETRYLSRPIALLMQNRWMHACFSQNLYKTAYLSSNDYDFSLHNEFWNLKGMVQYIIRGLMHALKNTSLAKERRWLRCRRGNHVAS